MGLTEVLWVLQSLFQNWQNIFDVLLVGTIFFLILYLVRGTRASTLLRGVAIFVALVFVLSSILNLRAFTWLLSRTITALVVAVPVIFQDELRHWLGRLGRTIPLMRDGEADGGKRETAIDELCDAVRHLARRRHGALIVIERGIGLQEYIDTGSPVDSNLNSELLQTIFFPNTPLHDGAVIIRGNRLAAAACTLPLSAARRLPDRQMGLRHRASLGVSEVSDAVTIVVSEETGRISMVVNQRFIRGIDADRLSMILGEYFREEQISRLETLIKQVREVARNIRRAA